MAVTVRDPAPIIRFGLIGVGRQADWAHARAILHSGRGRIVAVCDADADLARKRAQEYGLAPGRAFARYEDLLECPDVDAVTIGTPNHVHGLDGRPDVEGLSGLQVHPHAHGEVRVLVQGRGARSLHSLGGRGDGVDQAGLLLAGRGAETPPRAVYPPTGGPRRPAAPPGLSAPAPHPRCAAPAPSAAPRRRRPPRGRRRGSWAGSRARSGPHP